jgi:GNAT superfamily N-acetyltransferase
VAGWPAGSQIEIRNPREDEWPACRMLLPEPFERGLKPEVLLAFHPEGAKILGAAAFQIGRDQAAAQLFRIRVVRTHRRQAVGTALLRRVLSLSSAQGKSMVSAFADTQAHPEAEPFLAAGGFTRSRRLYVVEVDLEPMRREMTRLRDRAIRSQRVPASARLVTPPDAPAAEIADIYDEYILARRRLHPAYIEASLTGPRFEQPSSVLLVDGRVAAMVVVYYEQEHLRAHVTGRAVLPAFRGGWANVLIMADALEKGHAAGIRRVRFESSDDNRDTLKMARKFHADTINIYDTFTRAIAPGEKFDA